MKKLSFVKSNMQLAISITPIVLAMILIFFTLARNEILEYSKSNLSLESKNYSDSIDSWTKNVLCELTVYKRSAESIGFDNKAAFDLLATSYDTNDAYPMGLYWGDSSGTYFDSSGWVPDEDFVVTERDWYIEGLEHDEFAFGEPYIDAMTGATCVSATSRIDSSKNVSVLSADIYIDYPSELVSLIEHEGNVSNAFFVTDKTRTIAVDSDPSNNGKTLYDDDNSMLYKKINSLLDNGVIGHCEVKGDDGKYFVDINLIENTNWYFVTCMKKTDALKDLRKIEIIMAVVSVIACVALYFVTRYYSRTFREIKAKASTDPLTGLFNRNGFRSIVETNLKLNPNEGMLLMLDMDNFKLINDKYGHPVGDKVLVDFANLLDEYFNRNKDIVARIGGDEFAIFSGRISEGDDADTMLERFMDIFHKTFDEKYPDQKLSVSIGGAFANENTRYMALYQIADKALYEAKRHGKNRYYIEK